MPSKYYWRRDLSKYTLKSFDSANEYVCDTNNSDRLTYNANGTQVVVADNVFAGQSSTTPYIETASAANGGTIPGVAGGPVTSVTLLKTVTAIADAAATTIFTVSVPNVEAAAVVTVTMLGISGAGGAISEGESSVTGFGQVVITRTPGVASVGVAATISNTAVATVAGGTALSTLAYSVTNGGEGVTLTNTVAIKMTIAHSAGGATNHIAVAEATIYNFKAGGATIA